MNKIPKNLLYEIKEHCTKFKNEEACGVIYKKSEKLFFLKCENKSTDRRFYFVLDPGILIDYDVQYIVHSHPICSSKPSVNDIKCSDELCIPFLIYSLRDDDFYLYENVGV